MVTRNGASASANDCQSCDGTSFLSVEVVEGERSVWQSSPCPDCHPSRARKAGRR